jgi:hypothetical protein
MADESGMSAMEYYYHTIGRIVGYLSNKGLGRFDLDESQPGAGCKCATRLHRLDAKGRADLVREDPQECR